MFNVSFALQIKVASTSNQNEYVNLRRILLTMCQRKFEKDFEERMEKRRKMTEEIKVCKNRKTYLRLYREK